MPQHDYFASAIYVKAYLSEYRNRGRCDYKQADHPLSRSRTTHSLTGFCVLGCMPIPNHGSSGNGQVRCMSLDGEVAWTAQAAPTGVLALALVPAQQAG